ncbi:MAG: hypothetical protein HC767_13930 [Akkermansiaceae bacterium]|nr:hypothetical protein [Akkermansiaceae bacterium]
MVQDEDAATLLSALTATEEIRDKLTLFAPTDAAFEAMSDVLNTLTPAETLKVCSCPISDLAVRPNCRTKRCCEAQLPPPQQHVMVPHASPQGYPQQAPH